MANGGVKGRLALVVGVCLLAGGIVSAFSHERSEPLLWMPSIVMACAAFALLLFRTMSFRSIFIGAVLARAILLFAPVPFTDDHHRYFWDGLCVLDPDLSPYQGTPRQVAPALDAQHYLFERMNSQDRCTTYPPVAQVAFAFAACFTDPGLGPVFALRILILLFEIASLLLLAQLLKELHKPMSLLALYAFNPLIIVELVGNLHTEVLMIPFCLLALLMWQRHRFHWSAAFIGMAAAAKLWPLMFLLLVPRKLGWGRGIVFGAIATGVFCASWVPFLTPELIPNVWTGLKLYTNYFEFNASFYQLFKLLLGDGLVKGTVLMSGIAIMIMCVVAWRDKRSDTSSLAESMLWLLTIYLFTATTVHPWYIAPLLAFAVLTRYRWPFWWSVLIVPTYLTYRTEPYAEPFWWNAIEYVVLFAIAGLELLVHTPWGALFRAGMKVERVAALLPAGSRVLDIGTGNGALAKLLLDRGYDVTSVDVVDKSVFAEVRPAIMDGRALPFADDSFDVVLLISVLHHAQEQESLLVEAGRAGKKVIVLEDVYTNAPQRLLTHVFDSLINLEFFGHPHTTRNEAGWRALFGAHRLIVEKETSQRFLRLFRQATFVLLPSNTPRP